MSALSRLARFFWPADDAPPAPDDLVLLTTLDGEIDAETARGLLASQGIPSMVRNVNSLAYQGPWPLQCWELRVRAKDIDRARKVLE